MTVRQCQWPVASLLLGVIAVVAVAQNAVIGKADPTLPFTNLVQVDQAPVIDGKLDDPCWQKAAVSAVFVDEYSFPPKRDNRFRICQRGEVLYLAIECPYDPAKPPKEVPWNTTVQDGDLWQGEDLEVFIDFDNDDTPGYYQFIVAPSGVRGEAFCPDPHDNEPRWNPAYEVKVNWTPQTWTAEYALPLKIFDQTKTLYANFGFNVCRVNEGTWNWAPNHSEGFHFPHRYGEVRGLQGPAVKQNTPGLFRLPRIRVNDRVIQAKAQPSLIPEKTPAVVAGPTVTAGKEGETISFEVNTWTDVAVWIEDGKGEVIRHLVAGLLGPKPPPPLAAQSLTQKVTWDRRDDWGKPVPPGKYQVKVGAGAKAALTRIIGWDVTPKDIQGIVADAKGDLYVVSGVRDEWLDVQRFTADGRYVSAVYPPPATIPPEKLKGMNIIDYGADGQVRFGSHRAAARLPHLDQPMPHTPLLTSQGQIIVYGGEYLGGPTRFYKINLDGSLPDDFLGPFVKDFTWQQFYDDWAKRFHFALDPEDESIIYLSGLKEVHRSECVADGEGKRETFYNAVCRVRWGHEGPLEVVVGKRNVTGREGGAGPGEFVDPQGIAFDRERNLWVCDKGNNRLQVFDRQGKFLEQYKLERPYEIRISRQLGVAYVMNWEGANVKVAKFKRDKTITPIGTPLVLGRELAGAGGKSVYWWTMALDESQRKPQLRVVKGDRTRAYEVLRVVDDGEQFAPPEVLIGKTPPRSYERVSAGWESDAVGAGNLWFDGNTGEELGKRVAGEELSAGRDGTWAVRAGFFCETITFYPPDWPRQPKAAALRSWQITPPSLNRAGARGFSVAPNGDVYIARYYQFHGQGGARAGMEGPDLHVAIDRYSGDGKMLQQRVIYELSHAAAAPVADLKGNIYVLDNNGRRIGQFYEADIAANLPSWVQRYDVDWDQIRRGETIALGYEKFVMNPLIKCIGTLYKFGPKGGGLLWRAAQGPYQQLKPEGFEKGFGQGKYLDWGFPFNPKPTTPATHWSDTFVGCDRSGMYPQWQDGVEWEFLGVSPHWGRYNKGHGSCCCTTARFSVDDFGRAFIPAAHRSTVRMVDTAGNELLRIGRYGNMDSWPGAPALGPGPVAPVRIPEIPLYYPSATALSKRYLYVTESRYARVLQVKLDYTQVQAAAATVTQ